MYKSRWCQFFRQMFVIHLSGFKGQGSFKKKSLLHNIPNWRKNKHNDDDHNNNNNNKDNNKQY